jgi:hypothetical protein
MLSNDEIKNRLISSDNDDFVHIYGGVCHNCKLEQDYGAGCLKCGSGLNFVEKKLPESFNLDQKNAINTVSGNIHDSVPFGSFIFRAQYFPGDIDVIEFINVCDKDKKNCDSHTNLIIKTWKILISIIRKLEGNKHYYYSESKIGQDHRYHFDVDDPLFSEKVESLHHNKLLKDDEFNLIMNLYRKGNLNELDKDTINEFFRLKYTLRWTKDEILNGYKMLEGRKVKYIIDALNDFGPIKIDLFAPINGNFIEITNFFVLVEFINGKEHIVNIDFDYLKSIKGQIKKLSSELFFKPFKLAKRIWALSRYLNDKKVLKILTPLLESNSARIYQINSEIETLILMFERVNALPVDMILKQIDNFKSRLVLAYDINFDQKMIYGIIDKIVNDYHKLGPKDTIKLLKQIKDYLSDIINDYAINYMKKNKLYPVPKKYIGDDHEYGIVDDADKYFGGIGTNAGAKKGAKTNPYLAYMKLTGKKTGYKKGKGKEQIENLKQKKKMPFNKFLSKKIKGKIPAIKYSPDLDKFFFQKGTFKFPTVEYKPLSKPARKFSEDDFKSDIIHVHPPNYIEFIKSKPIDINQELKKSKTEINVNDLIKKEELRRSKLKRPPKTKIDIDKLVKNELGRLKKTGKEPKQKKEFNFDEFIDKESKKIIRKLLKSGKFSHNDVINLLSGSKGCNVNVNCNEAPNKYIQLPEHIINTINQLSNHEVKKLNKIIDKTQDLSVDKLTEEINNQFPELADKLNNIRNKGQPIIIDQPESVQPEEDIDVGEPELTQSDEEIDEDVDELDYYLPELSEKIKKLSEDWDIE